MTHIIEVCVRDKLSTRHLDREIPGIIYANSMIDSMIDYVWKIILPSQYDVPLPVGGVRIHYNELTPIEYALGGDVPEITFDEVSPTIQAAND